MSEFQVTARKFRPVRFDDVVGQEHIARTLNNAVISNRIASGYIFSGPRGVGKTTMARILAKALNCTNRSPEGEPCGACESCAEITNGSALDVIEIDGASNNSVDDVRQLRENAKYPPQRGAYKLYIIDEVHMLSMAAFNALLKTLEEPPKHLLFVFATTELSKVPATILSRCQRFDFRRMQLASIVGRLQVISAKENIEVEVDALTIIAKKADGSMRDALSIFDQVLAYTGSPLTTVAIGDALNIVDNEFLFRGTDIIVERNGKAAFEYVADLINRGYDISGFISDFIDHLRSLLVVATTSDKTLIESTTHFQDRYALAAKEFSEADIVRMMKLATTFEVNLKFYSQSRAELESLLIEMIALPRGVDIATLVQSVNALQRTGISASAPAQQPVRSPAAAAKPAPEEKKTTDESVADFTPAPQNKNAWQAFTDHVRKSKSMLATTLDLVHAHEIQSGELVISCADEFQVSTITKNKEFLREAASAAFGTALTVVGRIDGSQPSPARQTTNAGTKNISPLEEQLIRELGATPL